MGHRTWHLEDASEAWSIWDGEIAVELDDDGMWLRVRADRYDQWSPAVKMPELTTRAHNDFVVGLDGEKIDLREAF